MVISLYIYTFVWVLLIHPKPRSKWVAGAIKSSVPQFWPPVFGFLILHCTFVLFCLCKKAYTTPGPYFEAWFTLYKFQKKIITNVVILYLLSLTNYSPVLVNSANYLVFKYNVYTNVTGWYKVHNYTCLLCNWRNLLLLSSPLL